jgi:hypothetical protein
MYSRRCRVLNQAEPVRVSVRRRLWTRSINVWIDNKQRLRILNGRPQQAPVLSNRRRRAPSAGGFMVDFDFVSGKRTLAVAEVRNIQG